MFSFTRFYPLINQIGLRVFWNHSVGWRPLRRHEQRPQNKEHVLSSFPNGEYVPTSCSFWFRRYKRLKFELPIFFQLPKVLKFAIMFGHSTLSNWNFNVFGPFLLDLVFLYWTEYMLICLSSSLKQLILACSQRIINIFIVKNYAIKWYCFQTKLTQFWNVLVLQITSKMFDA